MILAELPVRSGMKNVDNERPAVEESAYFTAALAAVIFVRMGLGFVMP